MVNKGLRPKTPNRFPTRTTNEKTYLDSMMSGTQQRGYSCVTGCTSCVSCGGNDYALRRK